MTLVPILAIVLCTLFLSKGDAKASESPPSPPSDQELVADLLAKLLERGS